MTKIIAITKTLIYIKQSKKQNYAVRNIEDYNKIFSIVRMYIDNINGEIHKIYAHDFQRIFRKIIKLWTYITTESGINLQQYPQIRIIDIKFTSNNTTFNMDTIIHYICNTYGKIDNISLVQNIICQIFDFIKDCNNYNLYAINKNNEKMILRI